ncbi:DUF262 domain-containing protein [Photobacterium damselae subsp. damselae]|uniref:DUF262 domain-containing protein n=1 Tax=Photobacterium damselae TaxID=38293 RepID=UPI001594C365|nr:DUF262 domain-containing protein [Photobacterium damselae]NVH50988.1 DUF262 domain-containing protein [Photobacterium damselae subsp. damselae]NVO79596.1 DUF262 domain-containing protein [Photobacterium damselae subsp. damselae]
MKIDSYDREIDFLYYKIDKGQLDLQPDFQRAEVWRGPKKKLLIDTVLRGWHVPPVHVIYDAVTGKQEVLDGQQRLSSIVAFKNDDFRIDGNIEPYDEEIKSLDGMKYSQLPNEIKSRFDSYTIRVLEIKQYNQGEPGELFNRLNESLKLTSAEKRNAYVGELRSQMKYLVLKLDEYGITNSFLGFSNQRLAYHDLFVKLCYSLQKGSLFVKYSEKDLNKLARDDISFDDSVINSMEYAIFIFSKIKEKLEDGFLNVHITKATVFSWLFLIADLNLKGFSNDSVIINGFLDFESKRYNHKNNNDISFDGFELDFDIVNSIFLIFNERATSRVTTTSSLAIRDVIISMFLYLNSPGVDIFSKDKEDTIIDMIKSFDNKNVKSILEDYAEDVVWGL